MDSQQFAYWLQGFAELNEQPPTAEQWKSIREHLALVFKKVTPAAASPKIPDLKDSPEIKDLIERARKIQWLHPPDTTYYLKPHCTGDPPLQPGTIIC